MASIPLQKVFLLNEDEVVEAKAQGFTGALDTGSQPTFENGDIAKLSGGFWVRATTSDNANLALAKEKGTDPYFRNDTKNAASTSTVKSSAQFVKLGGNRVIISTSPATALTSGHLTSGTAYQLGFDAASGCFYVNNGTATNGCVVIEGLLSDLIAKYGTGPAAQVLNPGSFQQGFGQVNDTGVRVVARFIDSACY